MFVYRLNTEGLYERDRFQGADRIISPTFPELNLTVAQVLGA
jgi:Uma2 family endonuclease